MERLLLEQNEHCEHYEQRFAVTCKARDQFQADLTAGAF
jgi:hypothetical protein